MTITATSPIAALKLPAAATKALAEAKIDTVGKLTARTRAGLADTWLRQFLGDISKAFDKHGLSFEPEGGRWNKCPACAACPECGMPRATEARNVVVDVRGRAKHVTAGGTPCDGCHAHHRQLVDAANALAGV